MSGWKDWQIGEVVEAGEFQSYVQNQVVQQYPDSAARGSAVATPVPGMVSYLDSTKTLEAFDGTSWVAVGQQSPNYIINGAFDFNQRGFTTTTTSGAFGHDRFFFTGIDGTTTYSAQTFTPGAAPVAGYEYTNFARLVTTGQTLTSAQSRLRQRVEDVRTLAGQTATLSFWAKAGSGTPSIAANLAQIPIGSAGVDLAGQKATLSTSWARYSFTFTLPSLSGAIISANNRLEVNIWVSAGSDQNTNTSSLGIQSNTFDIWGVQLEAGSVATPFRRNAPSLQAELAACQRYFVRGGSGAIGRAISATSARLLYKMPVTMRATPTVVYAGAFNMLEVNAGSRAVTSASGAFLTNGDSAYLVLDASGGGMTSPNMVFITEQGNIDFSAEL
jgi:hypothetical protein